MGNKFSLPNFCIQNCWGKVGAPNWISSKSFRTNSFQQSYKQEGQKLPRLFAIYKVSLQVIVSDFKQIVPYYSSVVNSFNQIISVRYYTWFSKLIHCWTTHQSWLALSSVALTTVDWGFLHAGQDPDGVRDPAYLIPFPRQVLVLNTDLSQPWIPSSYC